MPTIGAMLVSKRFRDTFQHLEDVEIQFIPAVIQNEKGEKNNDFFCLNVLIKLSLLDFSRSLYLPSKYSADDALLDVKQAFYHEEKMKPYSIARMDEKWTSVIVSEDFVKTAKKAKLKGFRFNPEGYTIYTEKGLEDIREQMKKTY